MNILAIDPGMGGGIAFYKNDQTVSAVSMPKTSKEMAEYFIHVKDTYGQFICFIEKVQMWRGDSSEENRGKQFAIGKMMENYTSVITVLSLSKIPYIEVPPRTWQKDLDLYFPKKEKQERKNLYKRFAAKRYPTIKPTLKTADALCVLSFGRQKLILSPSWVSENLQNTERLKLF